VVEHLSSKREALSFKPQCGQKKRARGPEKNTHVAGVQSVVSTCLVCEALVSSQYHKITTSEVGCSGEGSEHSQEASGTG
jgi:hypothetical protein